MGHTNFYAINQPFLRAALFLFVFFQVPSFSLAYESAESDIMKYLPRSPDERLVSLRMINCSYLQAGLICAAGAHFCYFVVFGECGFRPYDLIGIRDNFEDASIQDLQDSYGQEWVNVLLHTKN